MKRKRLKKGQIILNIIFIIMAFTYIYPLCLCIGVSLSDENSLIVDGYRVFPNAFSTAAYRMVFRNPKQIIQSYLTTISFTAISTVLATLVMGLLAYPLSRSNYRFGKVLSFYVFFTMLFSGGLVPTYLLLTKYLHMNNTLFVYIVPSLVSAYNVMIIRTNYKSVPVELVEAAKVDGAGEWFICFRIIMPLCKSALASIAFLYLVGKWNDWMTSMLYITEPKLMSLQYLLQRILNEAEYLKQLASTGSLMGTEVFPTESFRYAMAIIAAGPVLVIFPFFQKYFSKGMTLGGVKG